MNGPEQYREAEGCLRVAAEVTDLEEAKFHHDRAQVHATLAVAAAIAAAGLNLMDEDDFREWDKVAGVPLGGGE